MLSHEELLRTVRYDPETGLFFRLIAHPKRPIGSVCGGIKPDGRRYLCVGSKDYQASRLAVFYMTGAWPSAWVDHRNRIKSDDRWENLREATPSQNNRNSSMKNTNTSGCKGVSFRKKTGDWYAYITYHGKMRSLGFYKAFEDAKEIATLAREMCYGEFYAKAA